MKIKLALALVAVVAIVAYAQTFSPPTISLGPPIATSASQCPISPAHGYTWCPVETGPGTGALYYSVNGGLPQLFQGTSTTVTVGTVTTLPAGSPATVTNSGTPTAAVLNFGIPAGATGAAGIQGIPGPVQSFGTAKCPAFSMGGGAGGGSITIGPGCSQTTP